MSFTPNAPQEERTLIGHCIAGDSAAWDELARAHGDRLARVIRRALARYGVPAETGRVDDLLQDTFVELLRDRAEALRRFQGECPLDAYLASIAVHRTIAWLRRDGRESRLRADGGEETLRRDLAADSLEGPAQAMEASERGERLQAALGRLSDRDRLALELFYAESLPAPAIARILHLSAEAVWPHLMRARRRLAGILRHALFL